MRTLRDADRIYFMTWRIEDLLAFLPVAFLAGRKGVIAGIHASMLIRRPDLVMLSIWARLGVLRAVHTIDSQSASTFGSLPVTVVQIPNGIDCDFFKPGEKNQESYVVLFAGSASAAKGTDLLPEIYSRLKDKKLPGLEMWICTSETGKLGGEISRWCEGRRDVMFRGWVSRADLALLYRQASVLLMPSRREVQGLSALEAQASGTPIIATDLPSFRESVAEGKTGFLVKDYQASAFADKILQLYSMWVQRTPYEEMCRMARSNAVENFSSSRSVPSLLKVIVGS